MIVASNAEVRRLRNHRLTLLVIVALNACSLVWNDHGAMFVMLCANAFVWATMLREAHRELAEVSAPIESITTSTTKEARMD
jgi:hypothetical protein